MLSSLFFSTVIGGLGLGHLVVASGDYGPDTCLEGWVWREAFAGDHVCVTPDIRTQAANDNADAANRIDPNGPYGPDTCINGYVWREADGYDHVCVTPSTRDQAAADNAEADNRRASLDIWLSQWAPGAVCHDDGTCTITSDSDIPRFEINGDHFNYASVTVGIYHSNDDSPIWTYDLTPSFHDGYVAGSFGVQAPVIDCSGDPNAKVDSYARAYDSNSDRWSTPIYVSTTCVVL